MLLFVFTLQRGKCLWLVKTATYTSGIIKSFEIEVIFPTNDQRSVAFILQIEKLIFLKYNNYTKNFKN